MNKPTMYGSITGFSFEPKWRVLYLRGYFWSPFHTKEIRVIIDGDQEVGKADLGWRYVDSRFFNERYRGFVFERQIDTPMKRGILIEVHCYDEQGNKFVSKRLLGEHPGKDKQKSTVASYAGDYSRLYIWFGELLPLKIRKFPPIQFLVRIVKPAFLKKSARSRKIHSAIKTSRGQNYKKSNKNSKKMSFLERENIIFFSVHNLDVEERREKRRCFEKIDQALRQWDWRILTIHHSNFDVETSLDVVQMLENEIPSDWRDPTWLTMPAAKYALFEATSLLIGYMKDKKKHMSWEEGYSQVLKEAMIFEYLVRRYKPYACILWHQWNSMAHMNRYICEFYEIPFMFAHEGFLGDTLGIDSMGEMAESWPATHVEEFNALPISEKDLKRGSDYQAYLIEKSLDRKMQTAPGAVKAVVNTIKKKTGRPVIFYAGVNDWQTGMLPVWWDRAVLHSPFFVDSYDAYEYLGRVCEENDWYLLFKPHPNVPPRSSMFKSDRIVNLKYANILECVQETDVTITLLSTVAYVARVHSKPVVQLGRSSLSGSGAAYEISDIEDTTSAIQDALDRKGWEIKQRCWKEHVARLLRYYLYPYSEKSEELLNKSYQDTARYILKHTKPGKFHNF